LAPSTQPSTETCCSSASGTLMLFEAFVAVIALFLFKLR